MGVFIIVTILVGFVVGFIVGHQINKLMDKIDELNETVNQISRNQTYEYEQLYHLLSQVDDIVSDIEDKTEDKRIKFICKTNDRVTELYDTELLNIKPTIDKNGNAILIINYYDIEFCVNSTMFCNKVEIVNSEK